MGPKGYNDHGFRRSATDILIVDDDLFMDMSPVVMFNVSVVIGDCIEQLKLAESVP